ncbi:GbpC/Spa domain-containing protein [Enterococcus faecalis]|uniref:GbpC/Spa domain-containing protein n=5 Tax=Enterococcus faecalis TaxID=1351 RepID=UPI00232DE4DA|nr:GbpC/Spa domain-containing protein [Enterococcus faecalis]MDB1573053.1 GbpC/Spa domain-containing protein [Enterococcus faecalis]MDB1578295.1 GbpC/Spa domain-containing protein [Enterococcus faecalis]MDB1582146.1 GbpC/Spa domain-containing protein [Enterococcus faecalis]
MNQQTEVKKRFKTYKAKKRWVTVPILFLGVLGVVGLATDNVQAAELDTQPESTSVQPDNPDLQAGKETPKTAVSEEATVQKDTTSQPTKVEEVVPKGIAAEHRSATLNDTTNVQQPKVDTEELAQEQPVVSPETINEPLGQSIEAVSTGNEALDNVVKDAQSNGVDVKEEPEKTVFSKEEADKDFKEQENKVKDTTNVQKEIDKTIKDAVDQAKENGVAVKETEKQVYKEKQKAQEDVKKQVEVLEEATKVMNEANKLIEDAINKAKQNGTPIKDGGIINATVKDAMEKAKQIADAIKLTDKENTDNKNRYIVAMDKYNKAKKELDEKNAQIKAENEAIAKRNAEKKAKYEKELAEHNRTKQEYEKNKNKEGYTKDPIEKNLKFDRTGVGNGKITTIKMNGNKFVNGKELIKRNPQSAGGLHELVAKDFKGLLSDSQQAGKTKHGIGDGYFVQMSKNKPITVTYENLKANYNGTQITRAEFTYELLSSTSKDGKVRAYLFDDPSKTIVYGFKIGKKDKASARMKLSIRFFDKNGKEIKPEKGKPFAYSLASLNSRGEKTSYEFVEAGKNSKYHQINGSKVGLHGNRIYSKGDIDTGTEGIFANDWDGSGLAKEYYGAGVMTTDEGISFVFGNEIVNNPGFDGSSNWFAFNTDLKSYSIAPKPEKPAYEQEKPLDLTQLTPPTLEELKEAVLKKIVVMAEVHPVQLQTMVHPVKIAEKPVTPKQPVTRETTPVNIQSTPVKVPEKLMVEKADVAPELPHTGEKENTLLSVLGAGMLVSLSWFGLKKRNVE